MNPIFTLKIEKNSNVPIYSQLSSFIEKEVNEGVLFPGECLPAERELAKALGVSRGTVKRAYEELCHSGFVEIVHGKGTFITSDTIDPPIIETKTDKINIIMEAAVSGMRGSFTAREIESFYINAVTDKKKVKVAVIDCNPEALAIFRHQLSHIDDVSYQYFLLGELYDFSKPVETFDAFDILFTTDNHYGEVAAILGATSKKLKKLAVSPDSKTVIKMASMQNLFNDGEIGILAESERFLDIIIHTVENCGFSLSAKNCIIPRMSTVENFSDFFVGKKVIIMPPVYTFTTCHGGFEIFESFLKGGGSSIIFNYMIERGSVIYIEEKAGHIKFIKEASH